MCSEDVVVDSGSKGCMLTSPFFHSPLAAPARAWLPEDEDDDKYQKSNSESSDGDVERFELFNPDLLSWYEAQCFASASS